MLYSCSQQSLPDLADPADGMLAGPAGPAAVHRQQGEEPVTSSSASSRKAPVAVTAALIVLGLLFAAAGAVYLAKTAAQLPSFFPGHQAGLAHHHTKHALAAFALAVVSWAGAWFSTGSRASRPRP